MLRAALLTTAAILLAAAPASAAPGWTAAVAQSDGAQDAVTSHDVGYGADGTRLSAWVANLGGSPPATRLQVTATAPGGGTRTLLDVPSRTGAIPVVVRLAAAADGSAVVAWAEYSGAIPSPLRYWAAYRAPGSAAFSAPEVVFTDSVDPIDAPRLPVAILPGGHAVVGIDHVEPNDPGETVTDVRLDAAVHGPGGWRPAEQLSADDHSASDAQVGISASGAVTAAWTGRVNDNSTATAADDTFRVRLRDIPAGGTPDGEVDASYPETASRPRLAVSPAGAVALAYTTRTPGSEALRSIRRAPGATEYPGSTVVASEPAVAAALAFSPSGVPVLSYDVDGRQETLITRSAAGGFPLGVVTTSGRYMERQRLLAFDGEDAVVILRESNPPFRVLAVRKPATTVNAGPEVVLDTDTSTDSFRFGLGVTTDDEGSIVASYRASQTLPLRQVAFDGGAPAVTPSVPTTATAGVPVAMTVAAADRWSALAPEAPQWDFGDGTTATGGAVSHAWAAPGRHAITVSVADALGNRRTRTTTIDVAQASTSPPPPPAGGPGPDRTRPRVTLALPACKKREAKRTCRNRRARTPAWRTLTGTVRDETAIGRVEVTVIVKRGKRTLALTGRGFRGGAKPKPRTATLRDGRWSLRLPKLGRGRHTFTVVAVDRAGNRSPAAKRTASLTP